MKRPFYRQYFQRKPQHDHCITYEYWWCHIPGTYGIRLVKVQIPPIDFPSIKWEASVIEYSESLEQYHHIPYEQAYHWWWIRYIEQPDFKGS